MLCSDGGFYANARAWTTVLSKRKQQRGQIGVDECVDGGILIGVILT